MIFPNAVLALLFFLPRYGFPQENVTANLGNPANRSETAGKNAAHPDRNVGAGMKIAQAAAPALSASSSGGQSKADEPRRFEFIMADSVKVTETYDAVLEKNDVLKDYFDVLIQSPDTIIHSLEEYRCNPDILAFARRHPSFMFRYTRLMLVATLMNAKADNAQYVYVTSFIKNNGVVSVTKKDIPFETEFVKAMAPYKLYLSIQGEGLKTHIEKVFFMAEESSRNKTQR